MLCVALCLLIVAVGGEVDLACKVGVVKNDSPHVTRGEPLSQINHMRLVHAGVGKPALIRALIDNALKGGETQKIDETVRN